MALPCAEEALDELGLHLSHLILKKRGWHLLRQCRDPWADPRAERLRSEPCGGCTIHCGWSASIKAYPKLGTKDRFRFQGEIAE